VQRVHGLVAVHEMALQSQRLYRHRWLAIPVLLWPKPKLRSNVCLQLLAQCQRRMVTVLGWLAHLVMATRLQAGGHVLCTDLHTEICVSR
jgi:hypothetical protein